MKELGQPIFEVFFTERYKSIEDCEMVHRNNERFSLLMLGGVGILNEQTYC